MLPLARAAGRISGPRARTSFPQSLVGRPTPVTPAFKTSKHFAPSLPFRTSSTKSATHSFRSRRRALYALALAAGVGCGAYILIEPFRHFTIAIKRCSLVAAAVGADIIDYKILFFRSWPGEDERDSEAGKNARAARHQAYSDCHTRCAKRLLKVLQANGGIYIKLGQHISSVTLLPTEWSSTMRPLQDQCNPTPVEDLARLFESETGHSMEDAFSEFDPEPLGVASLAQVHKATDKAGRRCAVKLMHPDLEDFAHIDMKTTSVLLKVVKNIFPSFEFEWLGDEMKENLPLEMDFVHEAKNAERCRRDFEDFKTTSVVIPDFYFASKRVLLMEFIEGARVDNLEYLKEHKIDKNQVSQELARIFSQMVYLNGFFHADPHAGNLLIRPRVKGSRSAHNFDIVLLDHGEWNQALWHSDSSHPVPGTMLNPALSYLGLYFDLADDLRTSYARFFLSLIAPGGKETDQFRRQFAKKFAHVDDEDYPIFQAVITGRVSLDDPEALAGAGQDSGSGFSLLDMPPPDKAEMHHMRQATAEEGVVEQILRLLRTMPRRLLMILKLNDLTRSLDAALQTTHGPAVWLIIADYCARSAWLDDRSRLRRRRRTEGWTFSILKSWVGCWLSLEKWRWGLWFGTILSKLKGRLTLSS